MAPLPHGSPHVSDDQPIDLDVQKHPCSLSRGVRTEHMRPTALAQTDRSVEIRNDDRSAPFSSSHGDQPVTGHWHHQNSSIMVPGDWLDLAPTPLPARAGIRRCHHHSAAMDRHKPLCWFWCNMYEYEVHTWRRATFGDLPAVVFN